MTNMFKKTLVASAVFACAGAAQAAEIDATAVWLSTEYANAVAVNATTGLPTAGSDIQVAFDYVMKANYAINDTITFTFTGEAIDASSLPPSVDNKDGSDATDTITLSRISSSVVNGNLVAVYRVTAIGNAVSTTVDEEFTFDEMNIRPRAVSNEVRVTYSAQTSTGLALDNTGDETKQNVRLLRTGASYAALTADKDDNFAAVVDVTAFRQKFTSDGEPELSLSVVSSPDGQAFSFGPTLTRFDYTINGNFGWLLDEDGDVDSDVGALTVTGCGAPNATNVVVAADKLTFRCTTTSSPTVEVKIDKDNEVVIPDQKFTAQVSAVYTVAGGNPQTKALGAIEIGSWTLNGSKVEVPYMPYGAGITQVINLNNAGNQTGDVTVNGFDRTGKAFGPIVVASSAPGKQIALADAIKAAIKGAGIDVDTTGERVSLTLVTNVPADDVTVYSAYNVNSTGARLVVNSSNGTAK